MGLLQRMERKNTDRVVSTLRQLIPSHDPVVADVPCHLVSEDHVGLRIGHADRGYLFLNRCQMQWWARHVPPEDVSKLSGPLAAYTLAAAEIMHLMPANTGPEDAAHAIAAFVSAS